MDELLALIIVVLLLGFLILPVVAVIMLRGLRRDTSLLSAGQDELRQTLRILKKRIESLGEASSGAVAPGVAKQGEASVETRAVSPAGITSWPRSTSFPGRPASSR